MSGYRLRPKAIQDLEAIGDFIAADNPLRAVSFIDELMAVCARIAERPEAFQRRDDLAKGLRQAGRGGSTTSFEPKRGQSGIRSAHAFANRFRTVTRSTACPCHPSQAWRPRPTPPALPAAADRT